MNLEEVTKSYNEQPQVKYVLTGFIVEDGNFRIDCCACFNREDARKESKKFVKYELHKVDKDINQNL